MIQPDTDALRGLVARWRDDPGGTYRTWFVWEERLKNFRSIRRGLRAVAEEIAAGRFGGAYRGSPLETVVGSVAEQRQIFRGADHAFQWKPKPRIPDIHEDEGNQRAFGRMLEECAGCDDERRVVAAIRALDARGVEGLGPAVASLLYFLHPTLVPPSDTAIVRGWNAVSGARVRLDRWDDCLAMREGALALNAALRGAGLSNDLGALAGLLFDVGSGRHPAPPPLGGEDHAAARAAWEADLARVRAEAGPAAADGRGAAGRDDADRTHTELQG